MNASEKNWYSIELSKKYAGVFKAYLRNADIYYEPSEAGQGTHFECRMTEEEYESASIFLRDMNRLMG